MNPSQNINKKVSEGGWADSKRQRDSLGTPGFRDTDSHTPMARCSLGPAHNTTHTGSPVGDRQAGQHAAHLGVLAVTHFSKVQAGDHSKSSCEALEQQPHDGGQQKHPEQLRRKQWHSSGS